MDNAKLALATLRFVFNGVVRTENGRLPEQLAEYAIVQLANDKGYPDEMMRNLSGEILGRLVSQFLLRGRAVRDLKYVPENTGEFSLTRYSGTSGQNNFLNKTVAMSSRTGRFSGHEAEIEISEPTALTYLKAPDYSKIPVGIIGYGAAGIIARRYLHNLGLYNITIFEKRPHATGIWSLPTVNGGSRNNPREIILFNEKLRAAPGSGNEVHTVLRRLSDTDGTISKETKGIKIINQKVIQVEPGDMSHTVITDTNHRFEFPILINACGFGEPRPMTTPGKKIIGPEKHVRAIRWQNPQLKNQDVEDKMFIFVGLGNSTAEMIALIQGYQDQGANVDYRVLTHYPKDAIFNPETVVLQDDVPYRVFRDLSKPNLTSFQGDLEISRIAYFRALFANKIISDVELWDVKENMRDKKRRLVVRQRNGEARQFDFDELYILTGYQHSQESLKSMGVRSDLLGYPLHDYDGEFINDFKADEASFRLFKGYFGFGSMLQSPVNKNAMVIPGMIFHAPDLIFGVIMRALEYRLRQNRIIDDLEKVITQFALGAHMAGIDPSIVNRRSIKIQIVP